MLRTISVKGKQTGRGALWPSLNRRLAVAWPDFYTLVCGDLAKPLDSGSGVCTFMWLSQSSMLKGPN